MHAAIVGTGPWTGIGPGTYTPGRHRPGRVSATGRYRAAGRRRDGGPCDRSQRTDQTVRRHHRRTESDVPGAPGARHRVPRPERRGQDDDAAHAARADRPDRRERDDRRAAVPASSARAAARGALLDAGDVHGGRSARAHLEALARSNRIPGAGWTRCWRRWGSRGRRRGAGSTGSRWACGSGSASPPRCSANLRCCSSTNPSTGWILKVCCGCGSFSQARGRGSYRLRLQPSHVRDGAHRGRADRHRPG